MWNVTARDHPVMTALRDTLNACDGRCVQNPNEQDLSDMIATSPAVGLWPNWGLSRRAVRVLAGSAGLEERDRRWRVPVLTGCRAGS
jgi:hypothetical protein